MAAPAAGMTAPAEPAPGSAQAPGQPAAAAPAMGVAPPPPVQVAESGRDISLAGVSFTLGEGWVKDKPSSSMRAAQYKLPGGAGAEGGELIVFYFGPGQGGDAQSNIDRWVGQFKPETDTTTTSLPMEVAHLEQDGLKVALVKTSGTYSPTSMGPMMPPQPPKPGFALFGLVIEGGPQGSLFIRAAGPKATMEAQAKALEAFARSARKAK
jgi:hypothetical protein